MLVQMNRSDWTGITNLYPKSMRMVEYIGVVSSFKRQKDCVTILWKKKVFADGKVPFSDVWASIITTNIYYRARDVRGFILTEAEAQLWAL